MGTIKSFEDLEAWRACRELRLFVRRVIVSCFPADERFRLTDQIIRSTRSSTSNIAEGYGRYHHLDNAKYCSQARGSCFETLDHLITAHDEDFITDEFLASGREQCDRAIRLLNGYIAYLQRIAREGAGSSAKEEPAVYAQDMTTDN